MKIKKALRFLIPLMTATTLAVTLPLVLTSCSNSFTNYKVNHDELNTAVENLSKSATSYDQLINEHFSTTQQIQDFFNNHSKIGIDGSKITEASAVATDGKDGYELITLKLTFTSDYGVNNNSSVELTAKTTFMNGSVTKLFTIKDGIITGLTADGKKEANIKIPAYSYITSIGDSAFSNVQIHEYKTLNGNECNTVLKSVTFEGNNITSIGTGAFDGCTNLTQINWPTNLTSIGDYAFKQTGLTAINLPSSLTSIGTRAFYKDNALTSISFDGSVQNLTLGEACFAANENLVTVSLPEGITTLPKYCLTYNNKMTTVKLPSSLTTIDYMGIGDTNSALTELDLSNTHITILQPSALAQNKSLKTIKLPNTLQQIGINAFYQCTALTSIDIPASVESISCLGAETNNVAGAFTGCSALTTVNFLANTDANNAATSLVIGQDTFNGCSSLNNLVLPSNVTEIQSNAFMSCPKLSSITVNSKTLTVQQLSFDGIGCSSGKIICANDTVKTVINNVCKGWMSGFSVECPTDKPVSSPAGEQDSSNKPSPQADQTEPSKTLVFTPESNQQK